MEKDLETGMRNGLVIDTKNLRVTKRKGFEKMIGDTDNKCGQEI